MRSQRWSRTYWCPKGDSRLPIRYVQRLHIRRDARAEAELTIQWLEICACFMRILTCIGGHMADAAIRKPAPKRPTNISLSPDVYDDAKRLGINLSQVCDRLLRDVIRQEKAQRWAAENA